MPPDIILRQQILIQQILSFSTGAYAANIY